MRSLTLIKEVTLKLLYDQRPLVCFTGDATAVSQR